MLMFFDFSSIDFAYFVSIRVSLLFGILCSWPGVPPVYIGRRMAYPLLWFIDYTHPYIGPLYSRMSSIYIFELLERNSKRTLFYIPISF